MICSSVGCDHPIRVCEVCASGGLTVSRHQLIPSHSLPLRIFRLLIGLPPVATSPLMLINAMMIEASSHGTTLMSPLVRFIYYDSILCRRTLRHVMGFVLSITNVRRTVSSVAPMPRFVAPTRFVQTRGQSFQWLYKSYWCPHSIFLQSTGKRFLPKWCN